MENHEFLNSDRSERVAYNQPEFPVYVRRGFLSSYPNYAALSHWHDDVEFIYILSGRMNYSINGKQILLIQGEGLFVNTRQLHYGFSPEHHECTFICVLLHPLLLCASACTEKSFIAPVLQNEAFPYLHLTPKIPAQADLLQLIQAIDEQSESAFFALRVQEFFFRIWEKLYTLSGYAEEKQVPRNQHLTILKDMIRYVNEHYAEPVSLLDICRAGSVGKTSCCNIFQKYTNQTPGAFLTGFRLKKSIDLLLSTDSTISEICFEVGFSGASYFTETFRKYYGCTPREYRKQHCSQNN